MLGDERYAEAQLPIPQSVSLKKLSDRESCDLQFTPRDWETVCVSSSWSTVSFDRLSIPGAIRAVIKIFIINAAIEFALHIETDAGVSSEVDPMNVFAIQGKAFS